jgi:hypothetical protein
MANWIDLQNFAVRAVSIQIDSELVHESSMLQKSQIKIEAHLSLENRYGEETWQKD